MEIVHPSEATTADAPVSAPIAVSVAGSAAAEAWPELMRAAQGGDDAAYRLVLRSMTPLVRSLARRRISDADLVEDVIQDTLLTVHRIRATYDPARPIEPWIAAITAARAVDALRRRGRAWRREVGDERALDAHPDPSADDPHARVVLGARLGRLLAALPDRQREAVQRAKLMEMTIDEAARESRLSVPAFKALLHRALARMRAHGSEIDEGS